MLYDFKETRCNKMLTLYKNLGFKVKKLREKIDISQSSLAEALGVDRVTISKIENGERKIYAEEVKKLSEYFNISSDVLLDLKEDIEVIIEKNTTKQKPKKEIRISVPQKNLQKFKEVLLYILNKIGSKPNIGESVLYKLLYFIDFDFYEKYEEQLIGATYIKNHYGPTPREFMKIVKEMEGKDLIKVKDSYFKYPQTKYLSKRESDLILLKAHEIKMIDSVLDRLSDMNATEISNYSHKDVPWLTTNNGEIIDYESVFYRTKPYSVRTYIEENI
jgi:transcriptional regulator with XRE-family HTH domain